VRPAPSEDERAAALLVLAEDLAPVELLAVPGVGDALAEHFRHELDEIVANWREDEAQRRARP
jgi:hypothetical protein